MSSGYVVAIVELAGPSDAAAPALASALGTTAYELKLVLAGGLPAVVLMTPSADRAAAATAAVRNLGHRAIDCARAAVVPSAKMTPLRDFRLEETEIVANEHGAERLPYEDVLALLRAWHRTTTETTAEVKERKISPGMAIATGGMVISETTTRRVTSRSEDREQVLYLFRLSGAPPFILRERSAHYGGLGSDTARTTLENFAIAVGRLRQASPRAVYDERLLTARPVRGVGDPIDGMDLLAHLVAASLAGAG
jgi:hypothetical protein